jgi:glycosyltransferase involved in cell wall biosynthesis
MYHLSILVPCLMKLPFCPGDVIVSIDADLQDDPTVILSMMEAYHAGADVVYGVRTCRQMDSWHKRQTAHGYYKLIGFLGAELVPDHARF